MVRGSHIPRDGQDPIWFSSLCLAHVWLHGYCLCTAVATPRATVLTDRLNYELTPELKRYSWDVIGRSEVRWTGYGETTLVEGHWFSGEETTHQYSVAFLVRIETAKCIISATPISSRLISIRLAAKPHNITAIQVYAPTSDHEDDEVEKFYEDLDNSIAKVPKKDILIVHGNRNAKVGPDAFLQWAGTAGRFGHGTTNERGLRLLEFAKSHSLTLANTLHPHKRSRTITWHAPNGEVHNQIDYILAPQRYKSSINKAMTRTYPGSDIGSDHDLVLATFKLKLNSKRKAKSPRLHFDLEKLKDPNISETFRAQIGGKFAALTLIDNDVDTMANSLKEVLVSTAEEVLGRKRRTIQPWVTNEVLDLCDKRRELRKRKFGSNRAMENYQLANKAVRKKMKEAKEKCIDDQCVAIEQVMSSG
ncbi:craniofacial development protein 2-like [Elysia marginata]|uniref:Craniofacial development protein 2-like n=1 Tax=Elysia marginata TaxID=1093978 RepID=A0AAV4H6S0_9GAST|nr:craniofacial development protein 2-like [Elysia marginata]